MKQVSLAVTTSSVSSRVNRVLLILIVSLALLYYQLPITADLLYHYTSNIRYSLTPLPANPRDRALALLRNFPIIDGHIDLPILARWYYHNQIGDIDLNSATKGEVDIPRLRIGRVGGFFSSAFVACATDKGMPESDRGNFTLSSWRVRDTLEQIDIAKLMIQKFSGASSLVHCADLLSLTIRNL